MALVCAYFKIYFLGTIRNIPALFFTVLFPPLMLLLTAPHWGHSPSAHREAFIVFLNYAVQTTAFMLLGMNVSEEKNSEIAKYFRTLPVPPTTMVLGRMFHILGIIGIVLALVSLTGLTLLPITISTSALLYCLSVALVGGIPLALMGMTIGYAVPPESARTLFTLLNLLLLFGAFGLPERGHLAFLRELVPTYQLVVLANRAFDPNLAVGVAWGCLVGYTLVFAAWFRKIYVSQG